MLENIYNGLALVSRANVQNSLSCDYVHVLEMIKFLAEQAASEQDSGELYNVTICITEKELLKKLRVENVSGVCCDVRFLINFDDMDELAADNLTYQIEYYTTQLFNLINELN